ncbi:MAG: hypothetical protein V3U20_10030 [Thermoplasmata archaeon]
MYDIIIWIGVVIFVALTIAAVLLYFQNERFDEKYKKNIEIIRAIKIRKLRDLIMGSYEQESHIKDKNTGNNFPVNDDFKELAKKVLESNKNLNRMMRKSADLKMWFDYLPRSKEFLVSAALWLFLLSIAVLAFCLALWAEFETVGEVRYSGYLSFILILMSINLFKNILRYNLVTKNINKHMNMIRDGEVEKF